MHTQNSHPYSQHHYGLILFLPSPPPSPPKTGPRCGMNTPIRWYRTHDHTTSHERMLYTSHSESVAWANCKLQNVSITTQLNLSIYIGTCIALANTCLTLYIQVVICASNTPLPPKCMTTFTTIKHYVLYIVYYTHCNQLYHLYYCIAITIIHMHGAIKLANSLDGIRKN